MGTFRWVGSLVLGVLWMIWGIDLVRLLDFSREVWWQLDLAITLWLIPFFFLWWWGNKR